jgi:hypothetical protein
VSYARPYLLSFRRQQQRLFDSTVRIVRPSGYTSGAGRKVVASTTVVYQGPGQVLKPEAMHRPETIGSEPVEVSTFEATVPHDVAAEKRDLLTVTASFDPEMVGRTFRVVEVRRSEWLVNRRLLLEDTGA